MAHLRRQRWHGEVVLPGEPLQHRLGDEHDIVAPFPQRREPEHDGAQPKEEVLPERLVAHPVPRLRATDPADLFVFEQAQQLGLETEGQITDLVEEQRPRMRHLEQARLGRMRVRERAALVAEQFRFDEVLGEGGAVDRDERGAAPWSAGVDRPREHFLTGPGLADDQGARVPVRQEAGRPSQGLFDGLALAHDAREGIGLVGRRAQARDAVERGGDGIAEDLEVVGKREVVARSAGDELHSNASPGIRAHHERRDSRRDLVVFEPPHRVAFGAARRKNDGHGAGARRDGVPRSHDVDLDGEVLGEHVPESSERFGDSDHAQPRHGGTSGLRVLTTGATGHTLWWLDLATGRVPGDNNVTKIGPIWQPSRPKREPNRAP